MSYNVRFGEIRLVAAIEGHKKGKGLVPSRTEFRIPPPPKKVKSILLQDLRTHTKQFRQSEEGDGAYFEMLKLMLSRYVPSRHRKKVEVSLYTYSIPALECGVSSAPCPGRFNQVDSPGPHCIGGWVGLGAGKSCPHRGSKRGPSSP